MRHQAIEEAAKKRQEEAFNELQQAAEARLASMAEVVRHFDGRADGGRRDG